MQKLLNNKTLSGYLQAKHAAVLAELQSIVDLFRKNWERHLQLTVKINTEGARSGEEVRLEVRADFYCIRAAGRALLEGSIRGEASLLSFGRPIIGLRQVV